MLFTDDSDEDYNNILVAIEAFATEQNIKVGVNLSKLYEIVQIVYQNFPHKDGIEKASVFKKTAYFLCFFVAESPIKELVSESEKPVHPDLKKYKNEIFGLYIVAIALKGAVIYRKQGECKIINSICLSQHSYLDILDALSTITPNAHFKLITVLLEQLIYKTNTGTQYQDTFELA